MLDTFTQNLANYVNQSGVILKDEPFNWLNPITENLSKQDTTKLLSNLPDEIQQNLLENSDLKNFFEDDVRALQLYLQLLPNNQILSEETLDDHIASEDFNNFFRENYVTNQAYKLTDKQRQNYLKEISQNTTWQDYVYLENSKNININKLQPNYSIQYFLTSLNPISRLEYLEQINNIPAQSDSFQQDINISNDLPELGTLSVEGESSNFTNSKPSVTNSSFSEEADITEKQALQNRVISSGSTAEGATNDNIFDPINESEGKSLATQKIEPTIELVNLDRAPISQYDQNLQAKVINQKTPNLYNPKPDLRQPQQSQNTPNQDLYLPEQGTRRKRLNYAKIVGYSSAAGFSLGASGLTILNTLFGS